MFAHLYARRLRAFLLLPFYGAMFFSAAIPAMAETANWCSVAPGNTRPEDVEAAITVVAPYLDKAPAPMAQIKTEHLLPHQGSKDQSNAAMREVRAMHDAALAWRAGAGDAYLSFASTHLQAWVQTYQPDLNPIDETAFDSMIDTYALIGDRLSPDVRDHTKALFHGWASGYLDKMEKGLVRQPLSDTWVNNFQSQRIKLVTMMAVTLKDDALFTRARHAFNAQLANNIEADGSVRDFALRDALHYVVFDLEPLLQAALAARSHGEDWYRLRGANGTSIEDAVRWLTPYATGAKTHQEFVHSTVPWDAQRDAAGVKGYSGMFDTKQAATLYWLAAQFDPGLQTVAVKLNRHQPPFLALCGQ